MNKRKNTRTFSRYLGLPMLLAASFLASSPSHATPYATALTNNGPGTSISFRINETNSIVTVVWTNLAGATITNNFGARAAGLIVTNLSGGGGPIPGDFKVIVAKTNTPGYLSGIAQQISTDITTNGVSTNVMKFNFPRGVAINKNPNSGYFGRIYQANSGAGTASANFRTNLSDGIYLLNADFTEAVNQFGVARTGTIGTFTNAAEGASANSPWRIDVGEDDNLYIADFSTNTGTIYVTDPEVLSGTNVLAGQGVTGNPNAISPSPNHGRIGSSIVAKGSLGAGNLVLYAIDADTSFAGGANHIIKYPVGSGPLPVDLAIGTVVTNVDDATLLPDTGITEDLAIGPDGKFYTMQDRSDGNEGGLFVVDPNVDDGSSGLSVGNNGKWDEVYDSRVDSVNNHAHGTTDLLNTSRAVAVSPDGKFVAIVRDTGDTWVISLTNGIPNLNQRRLIATSTTVGNAANPGRDIAFDAANNLYVSMSSQLALRVFSPGYGSIATTTWSAISPKTFTVTNVAPNQVVTITGDSSTGAITNAVEGSQDGIVTFSRDGDTSVPLTVTYVLSGTATRGADYVTNSTFGAGVTNTMTFPAGLATTNLTVSIINDSIGEIPETINFTLVSSSNYVSGLTVPTSIVITDDGTDLPGVSVKALGLGFYELLTNRPAKFTLSIASAWGLPITNHISLTGTAVSGVDYSNPSTFDVILPSGQLAITNYIYPIDNNSIAGDKSLIFSLLPDAAYTNVGLITVTNTLRSDDTATLPVLFSDNFDIDSSPLWKTNATTVDNDITFAYDYSLDGIPAAPHTPGGATTKGLKIRAHTLNAVATGISASPTGLVLTNDYRLRFDAWLNFNGAGPGGGTGSSEFLSVGMGVSEFRTNVVGNSVGTPIAAWNNLPGSAVLFTADGDGGFAESTGDYVVYTGASPVALSTNVYPANARDAGAVVYYGEFGDIPIPSAQVTLGPPSQVGYSGPGTLAFTWHDVIATKVGNTFTLDIDGLRIVNLTYATPLVGSNFSLGYIDENASVVPPAQLQWNAAIVDNLTVEKLPLSADATLSSLGLNIGNLVPGFSAGTLTYAVTNGTGTNYTVTATASHPSATLQFKVNAGSFAPLTSGVASGTLPLITGNNTVVVRVTAPDTATTQDYTLNVVVVSTGPSLTVPTLVSSLSGTTLTLSWPPDHLGFSLQTQTNALSVGLNTNWFVVPGSSSTTNATITVDPTKPTVFYRLVYP